LLTLPELQEALPDNLRSAAKQELLDKINSAASDPMEAEIIREKFISHSSVLQDGRFKIHDYLNAIGYVSFKMMNYSNQDAYARAFPQRYQALVAAGKTPKEISSYVANYSKGKLVNAIMEQAIIPSWLLHQDAYHKAIETQLDLMQTAMSEKVRSDAADSILNHLKRPETKKVEIDLGVQRDTGMESLRDMMTRLAEQQRELIQKGAFTHELAQQVLVVAPEDDDIDGECVEIPPQA
tara:strand:+ start:385 stop:1098 length:714 start_codon:yes stop_codon:yes gene_type:complete